jgi:hypothetical protein
MIPEFQDLLRRGEINIKTARRLGTQPVEKQTAILAAGPPYVLEVTRQTEVPPPPAEVPAVNRVAEDVARADDRTDDHESRPSVIPEIVESDNGHASRPVEAPAPKLTTEPADRSSAAAVEAARAVAAQHLDNALVELERVSAASRTDPLGDALTQARVRIQEARSLLHAAPEATDVPA